MTLEIDRIYCGDCLDLMREMPDKSVDTIITDPPFFLPAEHYQSRKDWGGRRFSDTSVLRVFWETVITEAVRVLNPNGHLFVFCNCDSYPVFYVPMYDRFHKTKSLVWDKTRVGLGHIFRHQHELIIWGRHAHSVYLDDHKLRSDVLKFPATLSQERDHPVEKPEALLMELIAPTTPLDGVVFDPFAGSGTTLSAAKKLGRHYIGAELDPAWHGVADRKVNAANEQVRLFDDEAFA
jgi:site-specific DNA-methyltransferase (adenine-specific)